MPKKEQMPKKKLLEVGEVWLTQDGGLALVEKFDAIGDAIVRILCPTKDHTTAFGVVDKWFYHPDDGTYIGERTNNAYVAHLTECLGMLDD